MAWLGERFNSFTEKISDFTKEVILNDSSSDALEQSIGDDGYVSKEDQSLIKLCEQQDKKINALRSEKQEMENSIVALDEQNQEAINELLTIKNQLTAENKKLKAELLEKSPVTDTKTDAFKSPTFCNFDEMLEQSNMEDFDFLKNNFNALSLLWPFIHSQADVNVLNAQIARLQTAKQFIESKKAENGPECSNILSKIDSYSECLNLIYDHSKVILPIISETVTHFKHSTAGDMFDALDKRSNSERQSFSGSNDILSPSRIVPASTQTDLMFDNERNITTIASYSQTDNLYDYTISKTSIHNDSQTEFTSECSSCSIMKTSIDDRNVENMKLKAEFEHLKTEIEKKLIDNISTFSQTDYVCECIELKNELNKAHTDISSITKTRIQTEELLNVRVRELTAISKDLEKDLNLKNQLLGEKDRALSADRKEIAHLKSKVETLSKQVSILLSKQDHLTSNDSVLCVNGENNFNEQEQLSISVSDNDKLILSQKLKELDLEKSKLLLVLNEKSQECSNLKSEVHRLTNIVASEKQAIMKLQKDNQSLNQIKESNLDIDLTKEALQNLSRLVRDKDVEIEALTQRNTTLADMIQNNSSGAEQVPPLIAERDELLKKIYKMKTAREKFMVIYNAKDQECRRQNAELKKLTEDVQSLQQETDVLKQHYESLSQNYEEKQKILLNSQNEIICLKQKIGNLEQKEGEYKVKYAEILNETNSNSENSKEELNDKIKEIEKLNISVKDKHDLIHEKDRLIHDFSQQMKSLKYQAQETGKEIEELKKMNCNQAAKLNESELAIKKIWDEKESANQKLGDKLSELTLLREMNERLNMALKEKEFFVQSLEEKISSLSTVIRGNAESPSSPTDIDQILADSKEMYNRAQSFHKERDESILALSQSQQETEKLKNEMQKLKTSEDHLRNELDRLRKHMLQVEDNYTNEAIRAETREKELRSQISEIERTAKVSNSVVLESSHQATIQVASLQEQIALIAGQRDSALEQLSTLDDKVQEYAASLSNLQLVLEQMQKGSKQRMKETEEKCQVDLRKTKEQCQQLLRAIQMKELQLEESSKALEAASRLSEQLDAKEEVVNCLKNELRKTEKLLRSAVEEINSMKNSTEGKVDRVVMKSLVLGYFSTPPGQKSEVVRLLARVLDFNQQEMAKAGIVVSKNSGTVVHKGIFSTLFGRLPLLGTPQEEEEKSASKTSDSGHVSNFNDQSFASLFVKFLESESQPVIPLALPAERMARELTSKAQSHRHSQRNQLLTSTPEKGALLIGISSAFPAFSPIPATDYSSPTILQEALE